MDPLKEQQQQQQAIETPPTSGNIAVNTNALFSTPNREAAVTVNVDGADDLDILQQYSDDIVLPSPDSADEHHRTVSDYVMSDEELDLVAIYGDEDDDDDEEEEETEFSQSDLILALSQSSTTEMDLSTAEAMDMNFSSNFSSTSVTTEPTRNVLNTAPPNTDGTDASTTTSRATPGITSALDNSSTTSVTPSVSEQDRKQLPTPTPTSPIRSRSPQQQSPAISHSPHRHHAHTSSGRESLFRYLYRSAKGRTSDVAAAAGVDGNNTGSNANVTGTPGTGASNNNTSMMNDYASEGEMDDDDDEESLYEEDSWGDADSTDFESFSTGRDFTGSRRQPFKTEVDWNRLPVLPNRFCVAVPPTAVANKETAATPTTPKTPTATVAAPPPPPPYLDASLLQNAATSLTCQQANEMAWEHGALLQAVLQLLAERDQVGVEGSMDNTDNIWKKGPLKKMSFAVGRRKNQRPAVAGAWKVKYVELRQGNLCYYEDSGLRTGRKTIHLRQADTVVQESFDRGPGFVFELLVQGSPTRYWMASSEKEREEWIRAIQSAMIGDDAPRKDLDLQPYQQSLQVYTALRESLQFADTQDSYLAAMQKAMKETASLQVPVQWVRDKIENDLSPLLLGTLKPPKFWRSPQQQLKSSITDFWKNMGQTTFSINGLTVPRNSQLASERIVGALTRCILEFDKAFLAAAEAENDEGTTSDIIMIPADASSQISELQAVSYARNILLNVLRSKERQDAACAVKYLLENPGVIVVEENRSSSSGDSASTAGMDEPVHLEVSFAGEDLPDEFLPDGDGDMATWVWTKRRRKNPSSIAASVPSSKRKPRHTYAVLSGTVLSYYAASTPRPHRLRGQLVLSADTTVEDEGVETVTESSDNAGSTKKKRYVLCIAQDGHQDWLLCFEKQEDHAAWIDALQLSIDSAGSINNPPRVVTTTTTTPLAVPAKMLVKGAERAIGGTINGGIRVISGAKDQGIRVVKGAKDGGIKLIRTTAGSGFKVIRGAVGMLRQNKTEEGRGLGGKHPSMKMLLNSTDIVPGKREPTVQCVVQTLHSFTIREIGLTEHSSEASTEHSGEEGGWISVQAKHYQAFLMAGGSSGRISVGDALVELEFVETNVEEDDGSVD